MPLSINTNILSLNAQRNLSGSRGKLRTSMERLSSGLRINSAKDDAAGLAISDRMTSQIRGLHQAVRNANDGISLAQTAEGAMQESTNLIQRIRELAVQSANATNSVSDRAALQAEVNQLKNEVDRIADTTTFNTQNILDGTFAARLFQVGANANETVTMDIGSVKAGDIGLHSLHEGNSVDHVGSGTVGHYDSVPDVNTVGDQLLTVCGTGNSDIVAVNAGDTAQEIAESVNETTGTTGVSATATNSVEFGRVTEDGILTFTLQGAEYSIADITAAVTTTDFSQVAQAINDVSNETGISATGSGAAITLSHAEGGDIIIGEYRQDTSGLQAVYLRGMSDTWWHEIVDEPAFLNDSSIVTGIVEFNSSNASFSVTSNVDASAGSIFSGPANSGVVSQLLSLADVDVSSYEGSQIAIQICDGALSQIDSERGELGAIQNRFESTVSNLQNISENLAAARSRILDADIAAETSRLTKQHILQQAGVSILSQANQQPQLTLSLLENI